MRALTGGDHIWDCGACLYPEGVVDTEHFAVFDRGQVEEVVFTGFQNEQERGFLEFLGESLPEFMQEGDAESLGVAQGLDIAT